jgi:pimeloyl-ACP methyl ester carboxylesterase
VSSRIENVLINSAEYQLLHHGSGTPVILYPSLGRPGSDFDRLARNLASSGFHAIAINPPGVATPLGDAPWKSLDDIADDLWKIIDGAELGRVILVGHAFGNRVVRATSASRPDDVAALILLACGGDVPPGPEVFPNFFNCFNDQIDPATHARSVKEAFFAPRNEVDGWSEGWCAGLALRQRDAIAATNFEEFGMGGTAPGLVVQGLDDVMAPPQNAWNLVARRANTRVVGLPDCGHAILPEQPRAVFDAVLSFLRETLTN